MPFERNDLDSMHQRLLRLERQNRQFKQLGVVILLVIPALLFLTCQSTNVATPSQTSTKKTVEANEFILKDGNGIVRARLRMGVPGPYPTGDGPVPQLEMLDEKGTSRIILFGGTGATSWSGMFVFDEDGRERGSFIANKGDGALAVFQNVKGAPDVVIRRGGIWVSGPVTVSDENGFQTILGPTEFVIPRSGERRETSAASLVMFNNEKNVIWKAP